MINHSLKIFANLALRKHFSIMCKCSQLQWWTLNRRYLHLGASMKAKKIPIQYEYDPQTDTFRPKSISQSRDSYYGDRPSSNQSNEYHHSNKQSNNQSSSKYGSFFKRFFRNLFLITGGVVWTGVIIVTLFVDVNETEIEVRMKDMEDHVRLLAFYDVIPKSEKGIWHVLHEKDAPLPDIQPPEWKEKIFNEALNYVKENRDIIGYLGKPVQLCGFLAAKKVNSLVEDYKNVAKYGYSNSEYVNDTNNLGVDKFPKKIWKAECILDAPKGLALLTMYFESKIDAENWSLKRICVQRLLNEKRELFFEENQTDNGIKLTP